MKKLLKYAAVALLSICSLLAFNANAQPTVSLAQVPLIALKTAPGLVMLNMSRDHRLYYSAYNDVTDLDGDGVIDVGFKSTFLYYGYFVSDRCYTYTATPATSARFIPVALADTSTGCSAKAGRWHGNWLNWALTSRMDALRKVLYGGFRQSDPATAATNTILEAANIPGDSHTWGKEFRPTTVGGPDGYNITYYTPLPVPNAGKMHVLLVKSEGDAANVYTNRQPPTMRLISNADAVTDRVWLWSSSERPVGGPNGSFTFNRPAGKVFNGLPGYGTGVAGGTAYVGTTLAPYATTTVRVEACVAIGGVREAGCVGYPAANPVVWKPTGVLHDYSKDDALKFGLLTGSYLNNYSGGVVRKDIGSFNNEINAATGQFTSLVGIAKTIDRLTTYGYDGAGSYVYELDSCGFNFNTLRTQGQCNMWGSPVAEQMYEGLRYFAGKTPTNAFITNVAGANSPDTRLGLPLVSTWSNPFRPKSAGGSPICSRPIQMVIADPITSFDSDQLPGAAFTNSVIYGAALAAGNNNFGTSKVLNVSTEASEIWAKESTVTYSTTNPTVPLATGTLVGSSKNFFMGQTTLTNSDGNPTAKAATTFATMRGHGPDETNTQGSYYAASVAKYGNDKATGIGISNAPGGTATGTTTVGHISVALGTVVPRIELQYKNKIVTLVPFSKSVGGGGITTTIGQFQPTGLITLVYFDSIYNTSPSNSSAAINSGRPYMRFMVSFSDMDQGGDNESDANEYYTLTINALGGLDVRVESYYQAGSVKQNMGYIISGTTKDGIYLEVADEANNPRYYLDTLAGQDPAPNAGRAPVNTTSLPFVATRSFTLSAVPTAGTFVPKDPLWYAAKYGGAGVLDSNGDPTNYFKIVNPAKLPAQMGKAFRSAAAVAAVASTSVIGVGQRSAGTAAIYEANFDSLTWSGKVYSFDINTVGGVSNTPTWEASAKLDTRLVPRNLYLGRTSSSTALVSATQLLPGVAVFNSLTTAERADFANTTTFAYLLGNATQEERKGGALRNRGTTAGASPSFVLGDIVNSDPRVIGTNIAKEGPNYSVSDSSYTTYKSSINFEMLAVGANDGFLHIFDADKGTTGGDELMGYMPQAARTGIADLASPEYKHRYFVDGPIGVGHAKIATPTNSTVQWRTVLVGTGGAGAQTVFAVDASTKNFTARSIMWEINPSNLGANSPTFGSIMSKPIVGKVKYNGGTWVAIFGNGLNSSTGLAKLYVVDLKTGAIIKIVDTDTLIGANGLGSIKAAYSASNTEVIDAVYGGDYKGNLWRFDLSDTNLAGWYPTLLYKTATGQPITAEINYDKAPPGKDTGGERMVYFGTGSYLSPTDPANTTTQALYGVYDDLGRGVNGVYTSPRAAASSLVDMTITASLSGDLRTTTVANNSTTWYKLSGKNGWRLSLTGTNVVVGERVIAPPAFFNNAVFFTSIVPSTDDCSPGLDTWITAINAQTGGYTAAFKEIGANSVRIKGGSPRGVFITNDGGPPILYTSQTVFDNSPDPDYLTPGGVVVTNIDGTIGKTQIVRIKLTPPLVPSASGARQVWRQLK